MTYYEDWAESGRQGMMSDFSIGETEMEDVNVLFATYTYENYSGSAFVLFEHNGTLFEVHGSHCSCYGLEDQWEPEPTTTEAIRRRRADAWDSPEQYGKLMEKLDEIDGLPKPEPLDDKEVKQIWY